jgi:hypothetical protein
MGTQEGIFNVFSPSCTVGLHSFNGKTPGGKDAIGEETAERLAGWTEFTWRAVKHMAI